MARAVSDLDDEIYGPGNHTGSQRKLPLLRVAASKSSATPEPAVLWRIERPWEEKDIPPRPWVAPGYLLRGAVTALAGQGSAGKSSMVVAWTAALALGMPYGRMRPWNGEPLRSLSYSVEDDGDELRRRYSGMARHFGCSTGLLLENLVLVGPHEIGTLLTIDRFGGALVNTAAMDEIERVVEEIKPDVAWFDPFVELHEVEENDNTAVRAVLANFRSMARRHNMAIGILFHTGKAATAPGDPNSIRGASSIVGANRVNLTLNIMTKEEANELGIDEASRRDFIRLDGAKANYSRLQEVEWFQREEIMLANGDGVPIPTPWSPNLATADQEELLKITRLIAKGGPGGVPWSPRLGKEPRSISTALASIGIEAKASQKRVLTQLKASGLAEIGVYKSGGKSRVQCPQGYRTPEGEPRTVTWFEEDEI